MPRCATRVVACWPAARDQLILITDEWGLGWIMIKTYLLHANEIVEHDYRQLLTLFIELGQGMGFKNQLRATEDMTDAHCKSDTMCDNVVQGLCMVSQGKWDWFPGWVGYMTGIAKLFGKIFCLGWLGSLEAGRSTAEAARATHDNALPPG